MTFPPYPPDPVPPDPYSPGPYSAYSHPADPYQQPAYPQYYQHPYGYGPPAMPTNMPTNALAIAALVCGFVFAPLGIVFGHIALSQIKRTGEQGRTLAIVGLVVGYVSVVFAVLAIVAALFLAAVAANSERNHDRYGRYEAAGPGYSLAVP